MGPRMKRGVSSACQSCARYESRPLRGHTVSLSPRLVLSGVRGSVQIARTVFTTVETGKQDLEGCGARESYCECPTWLAIPWQSDAVANLIGPGAESVLSRTLLELVMLADPRKNLV